MATRPLPPDVRRRGGRSFLGLWYSFARQFLELAGPYWRSERKWRARLLTVLLLLLTVCQVALAIWANYWNGAFYDSLEQRSLDRLLQQAGLFAVILLLTMVVTALHLRVKRALQIGWRDWLTAHLLDLWMREGRHYRLVHAPTPGEHDNPDGRIAEDVRIATELGVALGHASIFSLLILASFIDILLTIPGTAEIDLDGGPVPIPGYMVVLAFVYAGAGTTMGLLLGRPLVRSTERLQTAEADFRFTLAHARESTEAIALARGEGVERQSALARFDAICTWWRRQSAAYGWILLFTSGYGLLLPVFPILVQAPLYIAGSISLGVLMQSALAFQRLTSALSWPVDNLGDIARCRASGERVLSLSAALRALEGQAAPAPEGIAVARGDEERLRVEDLTLRASNGETLLAGFAAEVGAGERVLLTGDPAAAVALFKALAGLWQWGEGRITLPRTPICFAPQRPVMPVGSLRAALCYPLEPGAHDDRTLFEALEGLQIGYLALRLDEKGAWDQMLTQREQQGLGLARLLLQRPRWIILQEATNAFDGATQAHLMDLLLRALPESTVLTIGFDPALQRFHQRSLRLDRPSGPSPATSERQGQ